MMDIIILKEKNTDQHPLLMKATLESIKKFCPVSAIFDTFWFNKHRPNFFCLSPGDIFIRPPYDTVLACKGSFVKLDIGGNLYGNDPVYYSREVSKEKQYTETPVFHREYSDDPVGCYLNYPLVKRLSVSIEELDKAQAEHKKINIGPFFFNEGRDEVEFIFAE